MKIKLLITLICVVLSLHLLNAQTTYMPVFGDTTRYYWSLEGVDGSHFYYYEYVKKNDSIVVPTNSANIYDSLAINGANSKIWGIKYNKTKESFDRFMLMNLDLQLGEKYTDQLGTIHTVDSVYTKNNRKHIRFEKKHLVSVQLSTPSGSVSVDSLHFEFIEGVGSNICFSEGPGLHEFTPWLRSQYTKKGLTYGAPEWYPCWDEYAGFTEKKEISLSDKIHMYPSPVINNLNIEIPQHVNLKNLYLNIYNISGRLERRLFLTEHRITMDVSLLISGMYILQVGNNEYNETTEFVKS